MMNNIQTIMSTMTPRKGETGYNLNMVIIYEILLHTQNSTLSLIYIYMLLIDCFTTQTELLSIVFQPIIDASSTYYNIPILGSHGYPMNLHCSRFSMSMVVLSDHI